MLLTVASLAADADRAGKGVSSLTNSFDWDFTLDATTSDGVTPFPYEYSVVACIPNPSGWGNAVWGNESIATTRPLEQHVVDSGTCAVSGSPSTGWTLTSNNTDTSGSRYPTERVNGSSLLAGPYYSMAHRVQIFVPFSEVERENTTNNSGAITVTSCFDNFDPLDHVGVSNYGSGFEPGANGAAMPNGAASNNCSGPLTLEISTGGAFNQRVTSTTNDNAAVRYTPYLSSYHAGDGIVEPSLAFNHYGYYINNGSLPQSNMQMCLSFDNTTQKLTDRGNVGATPGTYAFPVANGGAVSSDWIVEYATVTFPTDDPLDANNDGVPDFNSVSGRYDGDWSGRASHFCDDPSLVWDADPLNIGLDDVSIIRLRAANPTTQLGAGHNIRFVVPVEVRDNFYGGPYNGQPMPPGVVMPGFGNVRSDEFFPTWLPQNYLPSPENTANRGDRMTFTRVVIDIAKSTVSPAASAGTVTSTLAGNPVVWQLDPVVSSSLPTGGVATNVEVTDILPAELTYDQTCTLATPGGTPPTSVLFNTPSAGETTLKWSLGTLQSTQSIPALVFCTQTDPLSPAGTAIVNQATINSDNAVVSSPATQTVTAGQAGSMQATATVDVPVDLTDDSQDHTLRWFNFSNAGDVAPPTVVNVFPYNGDGAGLSDRAPASAFSGTLELVGEPTVTFADGSVPGAGDPFADIGTLFYSADAPATINHDPDSNTSDWCSWDGAAFVPEVAGMTCPTVWSDVVALKHVSNYALKPNGNPRQGIILDYTLQATGNQASDMYTNVFGVDSVSLPAAQFVKSKRSTVTISSHSIGDWVFVDTNSNGVYDPLVDFAAPNGVIVELLDFNTNAIVETVATSGGTYLFDELPAGDYYVRVQPSLFSGILFDWGAAVGGVAANTDVNHDLDHNAFLLGTPTTNGVETDLITLSSTAPGPGQAPLGDEPVGDNIIPIADFNTNDDFSNLTIDLGITSGDADGDGMPDIYELGPGGFNTPIDTDGDGVPDYLDTDSDNDGIPDALEFGGTPAAPVDTDGDGVPDHLDIDSDNDGLSDTVEADSTGIDTDADGIEDQYDVDATGGIDADGNGIDDAIEATGLLDTDGDGIADIHDLDSDNDGLTDTSEAGGTDTDSDGIVDAFSDTNGDGMDDGAFSSPFADPDTDNDGIVDHLDIDSDNDGLNDTVEAGGLDADGDGQIDGFTDADGDGLDDAVVASPLIDPDSDTDSDVDHLDFDSDNDGIPDAIEGNVDSDGDGTPDYLDLDSDGDGIPDALEAPGTGVDTDGDGIDDLYDADATGGTDANNDGLDDAVVAAGVLDSDADGLPDYLDQDSDNDGVTDTVEAPVSGTDTDGDGIDDIYDVDQTAGVDADGDGIDDAATVFNTDGDNLPDYLDLDSDNDGIDDVIESGGSDTDGDGEVDGFTDNDGNGLHDGSGLPPVDTDGDGIPDMIDFDSDNDGIPDALEGNIDSDGDGAADHLDADSDADGIPDALEANRSVSDADGDGIDDSYDVDVTGGTDANNDGIDDAVAAAGILDSDADGLPDYLDQDSDNDGVTDTFATAASGTDTDNDGIDDSYDVDQTGGVDADGDGVDDATALQDTDGDGVVDYLDLDSDNDGISDVLESGGGDTDGDGMVDGFTDNDGNGLHDGSGQTPVDSDGDGVPDMVDFDSDADGIPDAIETGIDTDADGVADYLDLDSDNDGLPDDYETPGSGLDADGDGVDDLYDVDVTGGTDADNNGIDDAVEATGVLDTDADGTPDYLDLDSDGDGLDDVVEAGGADTDGDGVIDGFTDANGDGLDDATAASALPDPDVDGDGVPDHLDADSDNDGILDATEGLFDQDGDGIPGYLDNDSVGDGIPDTIEAQGTNGAIDTDGDGVPDHIDLDSDNDGIDDNTEAQPAPDSDGDGISDSYDVDVTGGSDADSDGVDDAIEAVLSADTEGDGVPDALDSDSDNDGVPDAIEGDVDTDGDGIPDYLDTDSDNDGIPDGLEAQV